MLRDLREFNEEKYNEFSVIMTVVNGVWDILILCNNIREKASKIKMDNVYRSFRDALDCAKKFAMDYTNGHIQLFKIGAGGNKELLYILK